jgi:putative ABC transport system permease protein
MKYLLKDLQYGARLLFKRPGFTGLAVLTLALGIGANTAIFSLVHALLLKPLPYREPQRLMHLSEKSPEGKRDPVSYPNFADWQARAQSFESMACSRNQAMTLTGLEFPARLRGRTVSWNFFQVLGVNVQQGRLFSETDDHFGAARTAILNHSLWQERFGGDGDVIGNTVILDGEVYTVVGVLPPGFEYFSRADVFVPIGLFLQPNSGMTDRGSSFGLYGVGRLKPGVSAAQADSEMEALGLQLQQEYPVVNGGQSAMASRLQDVMAEDVRSQLWILLAAVAFILLIACVNVANLLLVRVTERQKEIAVRLALGAGRMRIVSQLLSESLLIALLGGAVGLLLGGWMLDGLLALTPDDIPQLSRVGMDTTVLLYTFGVAVVTSVLCGLLPALHASRADLNTVLKDSNQSSGGSTRERWRRGLLVVETSLAIILLAGAGLLIRSMVNLVNVDPGFASTNLLTMRFNLVGEKYNPQTDRVFYDACLERLNTTPGVQSAALTNSLPIDGSYWDSLFSVADQPVPARADLPRTDCVLVSPNYFSTMGLRLQKGRLFSSAETAKSLPVVIINETLARQIWPGQDPIGKRIKLGFPEYPSPMREVIGVINDVKLNGLERETSMQTYMPLVQEPGPFLGLVVRTSDNPLAVSTAIEQSLHAIDPDLAIYAVQTMDQLLGKSLAQRRLTLILLTSFALLALLLASVGIYGVIAYSVRQRTREIGIRLALGARSENILRLIIGQALKLVTISMAIGLIGAWGLTRWMATLLFNVQPTDPLTFTTITLLLGVVAVLACWIPARRATKVDPMIALRYE